jgi:hypothetical protein
MIAVDTPAGTHPTNPRIEATSMDPMNPALPVIPNITTKIPGTDIIIYEPQAPWVRQQSAPSPFLILSKAVQPHRLQSHESGAQQTRHPQHVNEPTQGGCMIKDAAAEPPHHRRIKSTTQSDPPTAANSTPGPPSIKDCQDLEATITKTTTRLHHCHQRNWFTLRNGSRSVRESESPDPFVSIFPLLPPMVGPHIRLSFCSLCVRLLCRRLPSSCSVLHSSCLLACHFLADGAVFVICFLLTAYWLNACFFECE